MVHHDEGSIWWSAAGFEFPSFQFFQKCPNIDLTLTSFLVEIENDFPQQPKWLDTHQDHFWASHLKANHGANATSDPPTTSWRPKNYLRQKKKDDGVPLVLDSLDNYKMLSERMNVLTIYLPSRKFGIASDFRMVKTAVHRGIQN